MGVKSKWTNYFLDISGIWVFGCGEMKTHSLPYGHPSTLREGPFPCSGHSECISPPTYQGLTRSQTAWMLKHKPAYYTGRAMADLPHMPRELRLSSI
jgi:hypothetical protein